MQTEVIIPQKVTVLPNVPVTLTAPAPCTFSIASANIPGGGVLEPNGPNSVIVHSSTNNAEWGEVVVKGVLADGNFGLCECYFLVPFAILPVGEE